MRRQLLTALVFFALVPGPAAAQFVDPPVVSPSTNASGVNPADAYDAQGRIWGWADLHAHMFANEGFGGQLFWGAPIPPQAIPSGPHADTINGLWRPFVNQIELAGQSCSAPGVHGAGGIEDAIGNTLRTGNPVSGHWTGGGADLNGWPRWDDFNHQKMYFKWLERAFLGGQKLMVMHAVNNEVLCRASNQKAGYGCDDMPAVDRQLNAAEAAQYWIDVLDNGLADASGWFRIVRSPEEARAVIGAGKMAVVLGIEVDSLFGCKVGACTEAGVLAALDAYYDRGVRHVFPVHVFDNAFGGAAMFNPAFNTGNRVVNHSYMQLEQCAADGYTFDVNQSSFWTNLFATFKFGIEFPPAYPGTAHCNARTLTPLGRSVITRMMQKGMIVDVDHMSREMLAEVLALAEQVGYPLVSGHGGFSEISRGQTNAEGQRTPEQLQRIRDLGGMVAPNLFQGSTHDIAQYSYVPHDCGFSAKTWAQAYLYAVDKMRGGPGVLGVGMGSDFNGFVKSPAPRLGFPELGLRACGDDVRGPQWNPATFAGLVGYPFAPHGKPGVFHRQVSGRHQYDINLYGVAHVGLLPDFIQELKVVGVRDEDLAPLFHSTEKYLQVWEQARMRAFAPPVTEVRTSRAASPSGWYLGPVVVTLTPAGNPLAGAVEGIAWSATRPSGVNDVNQFWPDGPLAVDFAEDGLSTLTFAARQAPGLQEPVRSLQIRIDSTKPTVTVYPSTSTPPPSAHGWFRSGVSLHFTTSDEGSGASHFYFRVNGGTVQSRLVFWSSLPFYTATADGEYIVESWAVDHAGNQSDVRVTEFKIDRTRPVVTFTQAPAANAAGWNNTAVTGTWTASDSLSGIDGAPEVTRVYAGDGVVTETVIFADRAGNTASATATVRVDRTPPDVTWSAPSASPSPAGWYQGDVQFVPTVSDAGSGLVAGPPPGPVQVGGEGADLTATFEAVDLAGNVTRVTTPAVSIDRTPPSIVATRTPANAFGWSNGPVTVSFACEDALSGVDACAPAATVGQEGAGQSVAGQAVDRAGNRASATIDAINIDLTPPGVSFGAAPPAASGWFNHNVVIPVSASDALSGLDGNEVSEIAITGEGAGVTASVSVRDRAGNVRTLESPAVNIDRTPPVISATRAPLASASGWTNGPVTVGFACTDALSGVEHCASPVTVSAEGAGHSASGEVRDRAGNAAVVTMTGINIDLTPPLITCGPATPSVLWPANRRMVDVTFPVTVSDALSGATFVLDAVTASERLFRGRGVQGFEPGTPDTTGQLQAARNVGRRPRVYTALFTATDGAGNRATCASTVTVPANRRDRDDDEDDDADDDDRGGDRDRDDRRRMVPRRSGGLR